MRIDAIYLACGAADLRAGMDSLLARVVHSFESGAQPHTAYVFADRSASRLKVLLMDGSGLWLCTRRLSSKGRFIYSIAKHDDHLPLYRQEEIYRRSGAFIARSSMASWVGSSGVQLEPLAQALRQHLVQQSVLHADETPIKLIAPGSGKTDTAYAWVIRSSDLETCERAVVFEFCNSRQGQHAATLLDGFKGSLVCDDYSGYKALFKQQAIQEAGCWAHARRKFFEAHKLNQNEIAKEALHRIQQLYELERQGAALPVQEPHQLRQTQNAPLLQEFKAWLSNQRQQLMNADVTAKAMDYTLKRWAALTLHLADAQIPIDNNAVENESRPLALGRKNWLFVGSQQAGERAGGGVDDTHRVSQTQWA